MLIITFDLEVDAPSGDLLAIIGSPKISVKGWLVLGAGWVGAWGEGEAGLIAGGFCSWKISRKK